MVASNVTRSPLATRFTKSSLSNEGIKNLTALQMTKSKVWFLETEHKMFGASVNSNYLIVSCRVLTLSS